MNQKISQIMTPNTQVKSSSRSMSMSILSDNTKAEFDKILAKLNEEKTDNKGSDKKLPSLSTGQNIFNS